MAHQYLPKIFHDPHKTLRPPSYILNVRSLMFQKGQTSFKNHAANAARLLKFVWLLWNNFLFFTELKDGNWCIYFIWYIRSWVKNSSYLSVLHSSKATTCRSSIIKLFGNISQILEHSACDWVLFSNVVCCIHTVLLKNVLWQMLPCEFASLFRKTYFWLLLVNFELNLVH